MGGRMIARQRAAVSLRSGWRHDRFHAGRRRGLKPGRRRKIWKDTLKLRDNRYGRGLMSAICAKFAADINLSVF